jgi:hypothetical protein
VEYIEPVPPVKTLPQVLTLAATAKPACRLLPLEQARKMERAVFAVHWLY